MALPGAYNLRRPIENRHKLWVIGVGLLPGVATKGG